MSETLNNDTVLDRDKKLVERAVQTLWQPRFWRQLDEIPAIGSDWYCYKGRLKLEITQSIGDRSTFFVYYNDRCVGYVNNFFESWIINHKSINITKSMNHYRDHVAESVEEIAANS